MYMNMYISMHVYIYMCMCSIVHACPWNALLLCVLVMQVRMVYTMHACIYTVPYTGNQRTISDILMAALEDIDAPLPED